MGAQVHSAGASVKVNVKGLSDDMAREHKAWLACG